MDNLKDLADARLIVGCAYCDRQSAATRDHVPSKVLLDRPFPANLPVVPACPECNESFAPDEEYLACFLESVLSGTTCPNDVERETVARIYERRPKLRQLIEGAKRTEEDRTLFLADEARVANVVLKLARGHSAFELSRTMTGPPTHFVCLPIYAMSEEQREHFDAPYVFDLLDEIGSRSTQRTMALETILQSEDGEERKLSAYMVDWVTVQEGRYRYLATVGPGFVSVRIVLSEYLACEVGWNDG